MDKKLNEDSSLFERYHKLQDDLGYIEDPTYSKSIGSHVCITCSKFYYLSQESCGSILCCKWHQKIIFHGQHLTHSCEEYQKKVSYDIYKKLNQKSLAAQQN